VKNLVRSCGNDGELGCSGGEAALCRHVVRRIALATFDLTTMREAAAVCLCDISLESSLSQAFLEASNCSL